VLELLVAAGMIHLQPTIARQRPDHFPAVHSGSPLGHSSSIIHILYTLVKDLANQVGKSHAVRLARFRSRGRRAFGPVVAREFGTITHEGAREV
jgi:hypothetical protein